jgi:succinate dehydrogenase flavin-adding protein (antitoxin of CptAB toxin-antitoxin module)
VDRLEALQATALLAVIRESDDYLVRRILRWYSTTFHTPLHQVEELPFDYILTHYFETMYENVGDAKRRKYARLMSETDEERASREERESDDAFVKKMEKVARREAEAAEKRSKEREEANQRIAAALGEQDALDMPDIEMTFDGSNLSGEDDSFPVPPPKKR